MRLLARKEIMMTMNGKRKLKFKVHEMFGEWEASH